MMKLLFTLVACLGASVAGKSLKNQAELNRLISRYPTVQEILRNDPGVQAAYELARKEAERRGILSTELMTGDDWHATDGDDTQGAVVSGYIQFSFWDAASCSSDKTVIIGLNTDVCVGYLGYSFIILFDDSTCGNFRVAFYKGTDCTGTYLGTYGVTAVTTCLNNPFVSSGYYLQSGQLSCAVNKAIIDTNSTIASYHWSTDTSCTGEPFYFAAFTNELCLTYTSDGYSEFITCDVGHQVAAENVFTPQQTCSLTASLATYNYEWDLGCYYDPSTPTAEVSSKIMNNLSQKKPKKQQEAVTRAAQIRPLIYPEDDYIPPSEAPTMLPFTATTKPSLTPTVVPTRAPTRVPTIRPTTKPSTLRPTRVPTVVPTVRPSDVPSIAPSTNPSMVPTATPSAAPSRGPSVSPSVIPSVSPSAAPSATPSVAPTTAPSVVPSVVPSVAPSAVPTVAPTVTPSVAPSAVPTVSPSHGPSVVPSFLPTQPPSALPSAAPSVSPSVTPSVTPTTSPSVTPSANPSVSPSAAPSIAPSMAPSASPSAAPSALPTGAPFEDPTFSPTAAPSASPSVTPSASPSIAPSTVPSGAPFENPTFAPSAVPSGAPFENPTFAPSWSPSFSPSAKPVVDPSQAPSQVPTEAVVTGAPTTLNPSWVPTPAPSNPPFPNRFTNSYVKLSCSNPDSVANYPPTAAPNTVGPTANPSTVAPTTLKPSTGPTMLPSLLPSAAPSLTPTSVAPTTATPTTGKPTAAPTLAPSLLPSLAPSLTPTSVAPTTFTPTTDKPSVLPTLIPSMCPSVAPSRQPTRVPTFAPSLGHPTLVPTILGPTYKPSVDCHVKINVIQILIGISYNTWCLNVYNYNMAFIQAIVLSIPGCQTSNIINFSVTVATVPSAYTTHGHLRTIMGNETDTSAVSVSYTVETNSPNMTYDVMTTELDNSVETGTFNQYLNVYGEAYDATGLVNTVSEVPVTTDVTSTPDSVDTDGSSDSGADGGTIAGAVIGALAGVAIFGALAYYVNTKFLLATPRNSVDGSVSTTTSRKSVFELGKSKQNAAALEAATAAGGDDGETHDTVNPLAGTSHMVVPSATGPVDPTRLMSIAGTGEALELSDLSSLQDYVNSTSSTRSADASIDTTASADLENK